MRTGSRRKRLQEVPVAPPCRQDELLSASAVGQRALRHGAEGAGVGGALAASALVQRVEQHAASRRRRDDGGATAGSADAKPSHSTDRWPRSSVARLISDNLGHSASSRAPLAEQRRRAPVAPDGRRRTRRADVPHHGGPPAYSREVAANWRKSGRCPQPRRTGRRRWRRSGRTSPTRPDQPTGCNKPSPLHPHSTHTYPSLAPPARLALVAAKEESGAPLDGRLCLAGRADACSPPCG